MASRSACETHPERQKIVDMLLAGKGVRTVAAAVRPPLSHMQVWDYKRKVVSPALENAAKLRQTSPIETPTEMQVAESRDLTQALVRGNPVLERLQRKYDRYDRVIGKAEESEDYKAVASLDRAETSTLELEARLTGLLANEGPKTQVQIVIGVTESQPAALRIQVDDENVIDLTPR